MTSWDEISRASFGRAVDFGIQEVLNKVAARAGCRPLEWELRDDHADGAHCRLSGAADHEDHGGPEHIPDVLQAWARLLGLAPVLPPSTGGTIQYRGVVNYIDVEVWGIVDPEFFDIIGELPPFPPFPETDDGDQR